MGLYSRSVRSLPLSEGAARRKESAQEYCARTMGTSKLAGGTTRRRRGEPTYASYIFKVHKQIHPTLGMSSKAVAQVNGVLQDFLDRMIDMSTSVASTDKKTTLAARHVQAATRLIMPSELAEHGISEATKAVAKFAR